MPQLLKTWPLYKQIHKEVPTETLHKMQEESEVQALLSQIEMRANLTLYAPELNR